MCKVAIATEEELVQCYTFPHLSLRDAGQILSAHPSLEAAVVGAYSLAPRERELLIVDSGTAITFERVTSSGTYLGGNISPGLYTRLKALNHFTSRLPLLSDLKDTSLGYGTTTQEALSRGALRGLIYEVDGYIRSLRSLHPEAVVYLTGGDAQMIQELLEEEVYVEPNLVLFGLNKILEYNK